MQTKELITLDSLDRAKALIEQVSESQLKEIVGKAEALRVYARRAKLGLEIQNQCAEIKLRAERRLGAALKEMPKQAGAKGKGKKVESHDATPLSLKDLGFDKHQSSRFQAAAALPEKEFEKHIAGVKASSEELTTIGVIRLVKEHKREQKREEREKELREIAALPVTSEMFTLHNEDFRNVRLKDDSVQAIITDPPYPKEYLPLYEDLAKYAQAALVPGGSLAVMVGQSYLPQILALMTPHIDYNWTLAYLTPGGQSAQLWDRKVNTFWKPLLWFTKGKYSGEWIGDVTKSKTNDNDKEHHHWGQSESGMADIVKRFTKKGDLVFDPFMGAGTTGVAAVSLGRKFVGIDIEEKCVITARGRLSELLV